VCSCSRRSRNFLTLANYVASYCVGCVDIFCLVRLTGPVLAPICFLVAFLLVITAGTLTRTSLSTIFFFFFFFPFFFFFKMAKRLTRQGFTCV
jgi:hypothetical protein